MDDSISSSSIGLPSNTTECRYKSKKKECLGWGNTSQQIEFKGGFWLFSKLFLFCASDKNVELKV